MPVFDPAVPATIEGERLEQHGRQIGTTAKHLIVKEH
jgi:hypothetical protein